MKWSRYDLSCDRCCETCSIAFLSKYLPNYDLQLLNLKTCCCNQDPPAIKKDLVIPNISATFISLLDVHLKVVGKVKFIWCTVTCKCHFGQPVDVSHNRKMLIHLPNLQFPTAVQTKHYEHLASDDWPTCFALALYNLRIIMSAYRRPTTKPCCFCCSMLLSFRRAGCCLVASVSDVTSGSLISRAHLRIQRNDSARTYEDGARIMPFIASLQRHYVLYFESLSV